MIVTARDPIYKNKLGEIIPVANKKKLSPNEVKWTFLMKEDKDL